MARGAALKLRFEVEPHPPSGLFEHGPERCLILTPTHQYVLDPWLIMGALRYREWRAVAIVPEGEIWKKRCPPIGKFAPGAVYLQRRSGAGIVPMAVWMSERRWPRRRYVLEIGNRVRVPESLDLEAGASWLRERALELYERAARRGRKHDE